MGRRRLTVGPLVQGQLRSGRRSLLGLQRRGAAVQLVSLFRSDSESPRLGFQQTRRAGAIASTAQGDPLPGLPLTGIPAVSRAHTAPERDPVPKEARSRNTAWRPLPGLGNACPRRPTDPLRYGRLDPLSQGRQPHLGEETAGSRLASDERHQPSPPRKPRLAAPPCGSALARADDLNSIARRSGWESATILFVAVHVE
jgi:hypothetical protein